jgi:hypothetical protein
MKIEIVTLKENEDGSADVSFNLDEEAHHALLSWAIIEAIKAGIASVKDNLLPPPEPENE